MHLDDRVILIDKQRGMTSFAAVRHVRRVARLDKVGHCGSLDPNATGLLVLGTDGYDLAEELGLAAYFLQRDKEGVFVGRMTTAFKKILESGNRTAS